MENSISNFKRHLRLKSFIINKFSRSYPCLGKKDSKHKNNLTLIDESSEDDEVPNKSVIITNGNGVKKIVHNSTKSENTNHQGHYRQLSRDRQLPPVPDTGDFVVMQTNSLRKPSFKTNNKCNDSNQIIKEQQKPSTEDYGSICESETYGESRSTAQFPTNSQSTQFKLAMADEIKDVDPLYASVIPQMKRSEINDKPSIAQTFDHDDFLINNLNDHGYSIIMKKSSVNEFSSLRKPDRSKISKDYYLKSLQSLNNPAPGVPTRHYKQSELFHLRNGERINNSEVKIRDHNSSHSFNSIRRFSQPVSSSKERNLTSTNDDSSKCDQDILKNLQSTYNTPPIKRASLSNICQISCNDNNMNLDMSLQSEESRILNNEIVAEQRDTVDLYRRITVRESLASLRARNALPEDTSHLNFQSTTGRAPGLQHVYEGLYETLYYSSADNGRNIPSNDTSNRMILPQPNLQQPPNPLPYLNQDNYLSITENPLAANFPNDPQLLPQNGSSLNRPANDRSSLVYTAAGSDVYAEISDVYLSKQYEELPDVKQFSKTDGGQVNNGFIGCSSPGSVRVLLEIQSFRHMDSDVDISSRCTTPLHPLGKSIINSNKSSQWKSTESCDIDANVIRHPWYLPQKSSLNNQPLNYKSSFSSSNSSTTSKPSISKPKTPQNNLAIMTPLMERSMEGSSMFLDENKNSHSGIDSLYDLFKQDSSLSNNVSNLTIEARLPILKQFLSEDSSPDENNFSLAKANSKTRRIIYPRYSGTDSH